MYIYVTMYIYMYLYVLMSPWGLAQAQVAPGHRCCGNWTPWSTTLWSPPSATATRPWRPARPGAGHWASWNGPWRNIWRPVSSPAVCCWISWDRNLAWPWSRFECRSHVSFPMCSTSWVSSPLAQDLDVGSSGLWRLGTSRVAARHGECQQRLAGGQSREAILPESGTAAEAWQISIEKNQGWDQQPGSTRMDGFQTLLPDSQGMLHSDTLRILFFYI